jgi:hypothetical protein
MECYLARMRRGNSGRAPPMPWVKQELEKMLAQDGKPAK